MNIRKNVSNNLLKASIGVTGFLTAAGTALAQNPVAQVNSGTLGFNPNSLNLGNLLSFVIRLLFIAAGLAALIFMLLGALSWIIL